MKKSDLKTGMRVETREGRVYLVLKDVISSDYGHQDVAFIRNGGFCTGDDYHEDLTFKDDIHGLDIVKVYQVREDSKALLNCNTLDLNKKYLIWERNNPKKLTVKEVEDILGYPVEIVKG